MAVRTTEVITMHRFFKALPVILTLSVLALPATSDEALLASLTAMGVTVTDEIRELVAAGINSDDPADIGPIIDALDGDLGAIAAIISAAVAARPDLADQIVTAAIIANPSASGVITNAAINAVSGSGGSAQSMITNIVTAAVKSAPAHAESIRIAAIAAAPASAGAINAAVASAMPAKSGQDEQQDPPSPS